MKKNNINGWIKYKQDILNSFKETVGTILYTQGKEASEIKKISKKILNDPNLICLIVNEIHQKGIVGEVDTIMALITQSYTRLVKNSAPESRNLKITGASGVGKDTIAKAVYGLVVGDAPDYVHLQKVTPEALSYYKNKSKDWTWDRKLIVIEDPDTELINSQSFKTYLSGTGKLGLSVKNNKSDEIRITGKPNMILTTFEGEGDTESIRRLPSIHLDCSSELTKQVKEETSKRYEGKYSDVQPDNDLKTALNNLAPYSVIVPFATLIEKYLPDTVIMRTYQKRLLDYICASAVLYQHQRKKDSDGWLIATPDDYTLGYITFKKTITNEQMISLNTDQQSLLTLMKNEGKPLFVSDMMMAIPRPKDWMYRNLNLLVRFDLIKAIPLFKEDANKKVKAYVHTGVMNVEKLPVVLPSIIDSQPCPTGRLSCILGCLAEHDTIRQNKGLLAKYTNYYVFLPTTSTTNDLLLLDKKDNHHNTTLQPPYNQHLAKKLLNLKEKIKDNKESGYSISKDFLLNNFNTVFIDKCIDDRILIKQNDEYIFVG